MIITLTIIKILMGGLLTKAKENKMMIILLNGVGAGVVVGFGYVRFSITFIEDIPIILESVNNLKIMHFLNRF